MAANNNKNFVIFFSVNYNNTKEAERIVLLRQFIREGFGPGIDIITEAVLPANVQNNFFAVVTAANEQVVATALAACAGIYDVQIIEATRVVHEPQGSPADYCLLMWRNQAGTSSVDVPAQSFDSVHVHTTINLPAGSPCTSILLLQASCLGEASNYGHYIEPGATVLPLEALTAATYFNEKFGTASTATATAAAPPKADIALAADVLSTTTQVNNFYLLNEDSEFIFYLDAPSWPILLPTRQSLAGREQVAVSGMVYLWKQLTGTLTYKFRYLQNGYVPGTTIPHDSMQSLPTNKQLPDAAIGINQTVTMACNLSKNDNFHIQSPLYDWLDGLLHNTTYDAAWPEDSYSGEMLEAYNYWLSILPAPPKNGTVPASLINTAYNAPGYPAGAAFSLDAFKAVYQHLSNEAAYFQIVFKWFGTNGIINAINTQLANASSNVLTSVANLMQIPPQKSMITIILNAVFSDIIGMVSAIPDFGSGIAAVLNIAWSTVQLGLSTPDTANTPIQQTISDMANQLNTYTQDVINTAQIHLKTLYGNWGKLETFAIGEMQGKISSNQLGMIVAPSSADGTASASPKVATGYITAAANAWRYVIYKGIFATNHAVKCTMSCNTKIPNNPWNPAQGNYNFTWYLPAVYNNSKGKATEGYVIFDCSTDAPQAVKQDLFGPNSALNADPNQFFMGFNGWPAVLPIYTTQSSDKPPITIIDY